MKMHFDGEALRYLDNLTLRMQKAEAEVERLREVILENESFFTKIMPQVLAVESENTKLKTENALLRKVADAARVLSDIWSVGGKPNLSNLRYALAELDKAKEGESNGKTFSD